jgi:hypothetical protein
MYLRSGFHPSGRDGFDRSSQPPTIIRIVS